MSIDTKCKFQWEDSIGEKVLDVCAKGFVGICGLSTVAYTTYNAAMLVLDKMPNKDINDAFGPVVICSALAGMSIGGLNYVLSANEDNYK